MDAPSSANQFKLPAAQSITVPNGYFIPLEINAQSNYTWIDYSVQSNATISTALMNSNQFNVFNNSNTADISNSIAYHNGTSAEADQRVSLGVYYLVFYNPSDSGTANVTFSDITYPFTPFIAGPLTPPEPTGIASFGLYNVSGNAIPYAIKTSSIIGTANISSIQAYNSSAPTLNDSVSGATLQLNVELVAQGVNGSDQVYWLQDTPDFVTNLSQVSYNNNLWNNTDLSGLLSNSTVTSPNGNSVFPTGSNATQAQYFYAYGTNNFTYALPFDIRLLLNESVLSGKGVLMQTGVQLLRNGSNSSPSPISWFDNITVSDPSVQSAYFFVNGNDSTPIGSFYDAELVFCGEGNLETTSFTQMNSTLALDYLNATSSRYSPFPSFYSFGGDTGESAGNLHVNYLGNGIAQVTKGTPNYIYLGALSNATLVSTTNTTPATTTSGSGAVISSSQTAATSQSTTPVTSQLSPSSGASKISDSYFLALIPAVAIVVLAVMVISIRKRYQSPE